MDEPVDRRGRLIDELQFWAAVDQEPTSAVAVLGMLAVIALRGRVDGAPSMRLAVRAGFGFLLAGLASGVAMIVRGETLIRAGHRTQAYDTAGFLKEFHGITLNGILLLPLLAWALSRTGRPEAERRRIVVVAIAVYAVIAVAALIIGIARICPG